MEPNNFLQKKKARSIKIQKLSDNKVTEDLIRILIE